MAFFMPEILIFIETYLHTGFKRGRELRRTSYAGETVSYPLNNEHDDDDDDDDDDVDDYGDVDDNYDIGKGGWAG